MPYLDQLRLQRGAEHLCGLGPRAVAEFLSEFAHRTEAVPELLEQLARYQRLTPELLRAVGGNRFPPRPLDLAPDLGRVA